MSSASVLSLLDEPDSILKRHALQILDSRVNELWPEIADHIPQIEELYEDPSFVAPDLAALVVAKVYYNLGDLDEALRFALAAGRELDLTQSSEFVDTIISHSIRTYIELRQREVDEHDESVTIDPRLTDVVEEMLQRCVGAGQTTLALGIALEARRLDLVEKQLQSSHDPATLAFVLDVSIQLLSNREFRWSVLRVLAKVVDAVHSPGGPSSPTVQYYVLKTKIAIQLNDSASAVQLLKEISAEAGVAGGNEHAEELALQIAFDLAATASQELLEKSIQAFLSSPRAIHARIVKILSGIPTCDFTVTFLQQHSHANLGMLKRSKEALDARNSMFHTALSFQNALLHWGTTDDGFFRSNIDWLGKATHWTKFTATAALGVIHQGNLTQGRRVLQPYLTKTGAGSAHVRGGALYGLGLVFAGFGKEVIDYLQEALPSPVSGGGGTSDDETVAHGACLGIGLAGMRSQNELVYSKLRDVLYEDSAVAGEAAGMAIGLVMLGSHDPVVKEEMLQYAKDTQHEKIIRSLAIGLALLVYGKEEAADGLVDEMLASNEPILRYGGCYALAMAYAGTGSNRATKRLLHTAVSDAADDVRRAAVLALGFIYLRNREALPRMVELLAESHNPHVRYGTTMALGIACAGHPLPEAVGVLEPMLKDPVDFVRQGAMIALAMILVQQTENSHPRAKFFRSHLSKVISTKNEDALAKFGATVAQGILDAGGCNATISMEHRQSGNLNMKAVAGFAMFLQYWYWFPFAHFLSLAYTPTTIVCVTKDFEIPVLQLQCDEPLSKFDYPDQEEQTSHKTAEQLVTAILSTTLKAQRRARDKDATTHRTKDDAGPETANAAKPKDQAAKDDGDIVVEDQPKETPEMKLGNMQRVVPWQRQYVSFASDSRFVPVARRADPSGVLVVFDTQAGDPPFEKIETLRQVQRGHDETDEAPLPLPFLVQPVS